jgi:hypothetical protein
MGTSRLLIVVCLASAAALAAPAGEQKGVQPHPRGYVAYRTGVPLVIDGRLGEPIWKKSRWTEDFVDIEGTAKPRLRTRAKIAWDETYLYIAAELEERHLWGTLTKRDTVIFYDNDFEVFIDPDGDSHEYYEFEMNALNTVWDLFLPLPYKDGGKAVDAWNIEGVKSAVALRGTLNDPRDVDSGWSVEIAMPWTALKPYAHRSAPPADGDQWRVNFSRVEWHTVVEDGQYRKVKGKPEDNWVWSPQWVIDMHRPELWGYVQFSTRRPRSVKFRPDVSWEARTLLHRVYYAEREFHEKNKRWSASLKELALPDPLLGRRKEPVQIRLTGEGFESSILLVLPRGRSQKWIIGQDARIRPSP